MKKILLFALVTLLHYSLDAQITNYFRTPIGNTNWHHFTRKSGTGAAVYINQETTTGPILKLSSGTFNANENVKLIVKNDGSVGIGIITPLSPLDVKSNDNGYVIRALRSTDEKILFGVYEKDNGTAELYMKKNSNEIGLKLASEGFTYFNGGNVGIGNTTPASKLDVNGGINISGLNSTYSVNNFHNTLQFTDASNAAIVFNAGQSTELMFGFHSNGNYYWGTGKNASTPNYYSMWLNGSNGDLGIKGKLTSNEVEVKVGGWADFVFEPNYTLISLEDLEKYIKTNKHLPDVPSEKEVIENGLSLGQSDAVLLQKIEELTLYLIEQNKEVKSEKLKVESLESEIKRLKKVEEVNKSQQLAIKELMKRIEKLESKK